VRLRVAGKNYEQPLTLAADPRSGGNLADIQAKVALQLAAVQDIGRLHHAVNEIRARRGDLEKQKEKANSAEAKRIDTQLAALDPIEQALMQVNMKGSEANLAFPGKLNELYATFAATQDDADTAPTAQHRAMYDSLHSQLEAELSKWQRLRDAKAP